MNQRIRMAPMIAALLVGLILPGCSTGNPRPAPFLAEKNVGWLHGDCLGIKNQAIKLPAAITIASVEDVGGHPFKGVIVGRAESEKNCAPLLQDRAGVNKEDGYSFYTVQAKRKTGLAIGILGNTSTKGLDFSSCLTGEGVRFTVSAKHKLLWQGYYYMGYDMKPTCERSAQ